MEALLVHGANVSAKDSDGEIPLAYATERSRTNVMEYHTPLFGQIGVRSLRRPFS